MINNTRICQKSASDLWRLTHLVPSRCPRPVVLALSLVGVIGSLSIATTAYASTIYSTGFEQPTFVAGPLVGQDGWFAGGTPEGLLSPNAAVISTNKPLQGNQSVLVQGTDLVRQNFVNSVTGGYYDAIGSYRKSVDHDTGNTETVRLSAYVRVDGQRTNNGNNFFSASISARGVDSAGGGFGIGELAISSDGHVYGYSGDDDVPVFLVNAPVRLREWHSLAVEANFAKRTYSFFLDDDCLGSFSFTSSFTGNVFKRGSMVVYAAPDTATVQKSTYKTQYDQFSIKVVEPEECEVTHH